MTNDLDSGLEICGDWREVDRQLRSLAQRRSALDAEEAKWLREAERVQVWKPLGMVSMIDYLERVLGYAPRTGQQRLQVARALESLPVMTGALTSGKLPFSAVRELVRVVTPATERTWCGHVAGMNLRQIEEVVAGRKPGDLPTDHPDPLAMTHTVSWRVSAATYALLRQARRALDEEHGRHLDDDELVAALCTAACDRGSERGDDDRVGVARFQIAMTVCPRCERGSQEGAGVSVPVDAAAVEQATCDAQLIGSLDAEGPERAKQEVAPSVRRFVMRRDHGRCQTPGCRSSRGLELHHIEHQVDGGGHDPSNLTLRCYACHAAHHRGALHISGKAPDHIVTRRVHEHSARVDVPDRGLRVHEHGAHVGAPDRVPCDALPSPSRFDQAVLRTQARDALVGLGWRPAIAATAVDEARAQVSADAPIEELIREALRLCPMRRG